MSSQPATILEIVLSTQFTSNVTFLLCGIELGHFSEFFVTAQTFPVTIKTYAFIIQTYELRPFRPHRPNRPQTDYSDHI